MKRGDGRALRGELPRAGRGKRGCKRGADLMVGWWAARVSRRLRTYLLPRSGAGAASKVQPRKKDAGSLVRSDSDVYQGCMAGSGAIVFRAGYLAISMSDCIVYGVGDRGSGGVRDGECVVVTSPRASASLPRKTYRAHLVIRSWAELASNLAVGTDNALSRMESPRSSAKFKIRAAAHDFDQRPSPTPSAPLTKSGNERPLVAMPSPVLAPGGTGCVCHRAREQLRSGSLSSLIRRCELTVVF